METILKVKNLKVELEGEAILNEINFEVKKGETFIILGPNGAGKTVLLKALLGLIPFQGEVYWKPGIKVAYIPQRLSFDKNIPVSVEDFFYLKKNPPKNISQILFELGLQEPHFLKKSIGKISSGQFQRVLIAWSLVDHPDVLLFDEATAGIDIGGEETIYQLLHKIKKERDLSIILVTHELALVYKQATQVLCLNKKIICQGSPQEILSPEILQQTFGGEMKYFLHAHD